MKKLMACAALIFGLVGSASAGMITYNFTGGSGDAASYDFTVGGVTTTATATYNGFSNAADVTRNTNGIGVKSSTNDNVLIDGRGRNDFLTLSFANTVELLGFTFGNRSGNDEFDLYVDGIKVGDNFETTDGFAAFAPSTYLGTSFTVRANQNNDNFVLRKMRINTVPEPGTLALLGLGLAGLGLVRRQRVAA